jgi:hypothetical protein
VFTQEISEDNIGVLAADQQGLTCCDCRLESYLDGGSCIGHLGGLPSVSLTWVNKSLLFSPSSFLSSQACKYFFKP